MGKLHLYKYSFLLSALYSLVLLESETSSLSYFHKLLRTVTHALVLRVTQLLGRESLRIIMWSTMSLPS
jgi:hypothetical protein